MRITSIDHRPPSWTMSRVDLKSIEALPPPQTKITTIDLLLLLFFFSSFFIPHIMDASFFFFFYQTKLNFPPHNVRSIIHSQRMPVGGGTPPCLYLSISHHVVVRALDFVVLLQHCVIAFAGPDSASSKNDISEHPGGRLATLALSWTKD